MSINIEYLENRNDAWDKLFALHLDIAVKIADLEKLSQNTPPQKMLELIDELRTKARKELKLAHAMLPPI